MVVRAHRPQVEWLERRELLDGTALGLAYGQIPLSFEANQGQTDSQVNFLARGSGYALFLTPSEAVLGLQKPVASSAVQGSTSVPQAEDVLRMQLKGGNLAPPVLGLDKQATTSNYFVGRDPSHWRTNVANYGRVEYRGVYPGIDLVYYGNQRQLEYDFVVQPGADPHLIQLSFQGAQDLTLDAQGNLVLHTAGGDMMEHAPVVYQESQRGRQAVSGRYVLLGQDDVGFQVDAYDANRQLVIDPVLSYSTYLGGTRLNEGASIAVDASGNAYVAGTTLSSNFPTTSGAAQATYAGGPRDVYVAKLNPSGTALLYSTFRGGRDDEETHGIAFDDSGDAYITGVTYSTNVPTTSGAVQTTLAGSSNAFVAKLNASGTALLYSTYLGGSSDDQALGIAVDASGNVYIAGDATSTNFPTTPGAVQTASGGSLGGRYEDAFVAKLNPSGTSLLYSTFLGGSGADQGTSIAVDTSGNAYITGSTSSTNFPTTPGALQTNYGGNPSDAFVAKVNATGTALIFSTYLGGLNGGGGDYGHGVAVDAAGNAYVTGDTDSSNFPTTPGALQRTLAGTSNAFIAKLNPSGTALAYSTYLGGSQDDSGYAIAVDTSGNAYLTGLTSSSNFPTTPGAVQTTNGGSDAFVAKLNASGTALLYSTRFGGSNSDYGSAIALDASGNAYITGTTNSIDFPTTPGALQPTYRAGGNSEAFVAKIDFPYTSLFRSRSSANASGYGQSISFTATVTSGGSPVTAGTVTFQDGSSILATSVPLDGSGQANFQTGTLTAAGSPHAITASYNGSPGLDISSGSVSQTVNQVPLLVTADDKTRVYGQANPTFTAHYTGFVLGENQNVLSGTLGFSTPATVASSVGSDAITPGGLTSSNYAITFVTGTLTIMPASLTITADSKTMVYGAGLPTLTASYSGFVNGDTPGSLTTLPIVTTSATATSHVAAAPYNILASSAQAINYTIRYVPGTMTVTPAPLTITADNKTTDYGATLPSLTVSYAGLVNGDTPDTFGAVPNTAPTVTTIATAGSSVAGSPYPITVSGAADTDYSISYVASTLTVAPAPLTITANNATRVYGATNPTFTVSYSGFVLGDGPSVLGGTLSLATLTTTSSNVGSYAITPSGLTSSNYVISFDSGTLVVTAAPLTVIATNVWRSYGAATPPLTGVITGVRNGDNITVSYSSTAALSSPVGTYSIPPILNDPANRLGNYAVLVNGGTLTITPAPLTVTAKNASKVYGQANPDFTATYSGFVNGDTATNLATQPILPTAATISSPVGTYVILAGGASSPNYTITFVSGTLTITPDSTVTLLQTSAAAVPSGQPVTLTATVNPGTSGADTEMGSVVFLDQGMRLATIPLAGGVAVFTTSTLPLGGHSITAAYAGDVNHTASSSSAVAVTIGTPDERFVAQLYLSLLLRPVDAGGLASWTTLLDQGVSRTQVAWSIEQSQEWRSNQVEALYQQFLHRDADASGRTTYITFLGTGGTLQQLRAILTSSREYLQVRGGETTDGFLTALYQDALNRSPDAGGLAAFTQALDRGASRQQVAAAVFASTEYGRDLIASFYQKLLKRPADAGGLDSFVADLQAGVPDQTLVAVMLGSEEFFAHAEASG